MDNVGREEFVRRMANPMDISAEAYLLSGKHRPTIEEIKARRAAITPPPWETIGVRIKPETTYTHTIGAGNPDDETWRPLFTEVFGYPDRQPDPDVLANAEFIAHAPQDVDDLLGHIDALTAERYLGVPCPVCGRLRLLFSPSINDIRCEKCGADKDMIYDSNPIERAEQAEAQLAEAMGHVHYLDGWLRRLFEKVDPEHDWEYDASVLELDRRLAKLEQPSSAYEKWKAMESALRRIIGYSTFKQRSNSTFASIREVAEAALGLKEELDVS